MSKSYVFGELEIEDPPNGQTRLEKLQLVATDHWKNILIGGLSEIIIVASVALLTYFLTAQPICESAVSTISTLATSTLPITTKSSTTHWSTSSTPISSTSTTSAPVNYSCADGFTYVNHKCWKLVTGPQSRADADQACFSLGGSTLFSIRNDKDNQAVPEFLNGQQVKNLWTGLICDNNDPSSCTWDVQSGTTATYNNFAKGFPSGVNGDCNYYMTTGTQAGQWASGLCNETMSFVCELPATIYEETCKYNYNTYCYTSYSLGKTTSDAQSYCTSSGSNLVSIHSGNENRYVMTINFGGNKKILIGGVAFSNDVMLWYDGTETNFNNIYQIADGNCLSIDNVNGGWYGGDCMASNNYFICKRRIP